MLQCNCYVLATGPASDAIVVDPGDAAPVAAALDARGLALAAILVTHHHGDHVGGVDELRPRLKGAVYGPRSESIPAPFVPLADGDKVQLLGLSFTVIDVPGHTAGHIAYFDAGRSGAPLLISSGDAVAHLALRGTLRLTGMRTAPDVGRRSPSSVFRSVLLPEPEPPMITMISPSRTSTLTLCRILRVP